MSLITKLKRKKARKQAAGIMRLIVIIPCND
jgi:hypothetical protein